MATIGERRFNEGSGVRFMLDGKTIRCQGVSKTRLRKLREERGDWDSPAEDFWPEAQCGKPAEPGSFVCKYHGGQSPRRVPRDVMELVPINLREKLEVVLDNPSYLDRSSDIYLLEARKWELLERLSEHPGRQEAWGMVSEAYHELMRGNLLEAESLISEALKHSDAEKEIWQEIVGLAGSQQTIASTQVKVMKELKLMITMEQVMYLISVVQRALKEATERYIDDAHVREAVVDYISRRLEDAAGSGTTAVVTQLSARTESGSSSSG